MIPAEEKMPRLVAELNARLAEFANLAKAIQANLRGLHAGLSFGEPHR